MVAQEFSAEFMSSSPQSLAAEGKSGSKAGATSQLWRAKSIEAKHLAAVGKAVAEEKGSKAKHVKDELIMVSPHNHSLQ